MNRTLTLLILLLVTALWFVGCSDKPTDTSTQAKFDLNDDFGGYTATAETPGFGDQTLMGEAAEDVSYNDPMLQLSETDSIVSDPDAGFFHFRAVWGQLTYDSMVTTPTDWSGSLTITRGLEVVRRLIAFDNGEDYLEDRTDPKVIEWVSQTTTHHDGIAVDLFIPLPRPTIDTALVPEVDTLGDTTWIEVVDTLWPGQVEVTFATGPYTRTFTLAELVMLDTIVHLEDSKAVAFNAFKLDRIPCARGFLAGHWGVDDDGENEFRGMWMTKHGFIDGWLRGTYGRNDEGKPVFYGKWIDRSGEFEGFLRGIWKAHPNRHANDEAFRHAGGWFAGKIYDADHVEIGALKGKYKSAIHPVKPGYFQGMWRLYCGDSYDHEWGDDSDGPWEDDHDDDDHDGDDDHDDDDYDGGDDQ